MHHRSGAKRGVVTALAAYPALVPLVPSVMRAATMTAYNSGLLAFLLQILLTGLLIGKTIGKL